MFPKCEDPQFFVKGGGAFADRQKSIFDQLDAAAEKEHQQTARDPINNDERDDDQFMEIEPFNSTVRTARRNRVEMKQFRGKESIFKRPDAMPPRFKAKPIPDHHKNPHKWVKYSLGDVSQADMSNTSNTAAAFSFLQEIAARKASSALDETNEGEGTTPISFRQPRSRSLLASGSSGLTEQKDDNEKPSFKSSKLVMPEYFVGKSKLRRERKTEIKRMDKLKPMVSSSAASTAVNMTNIDGDLLVPFSWPTSTTPVILDSPVDATNSTPKPLSISSTSKKPSDDRKPAKTVGKRKRKQRPNEIPLGHLMDYNDEAEEDAEEADT